jgi:hypothetical protein
MEGYLASRAVEGRELQGRELRATSNPDLDLYPSSSNAPCSGLTRWPAVTASEPTARYTERCPVVRLTTAPQHVRQPRAWITCSVAVSPCCRQKSTDTNHIDQKLVGEVPASMPQQSLGWTIIMLHIAASLTSHPANAGAPVEDPGAGGTLMARSVSGRKAPWLGRACL